jgi:hypothetical protein
MKRSTGIAAVETNAGFHKQLVEKFVRENLPPKAFDPNKTSGMGKFSERYKEIECCAAELPVHGLVEILALARVNTWRFSIPVTSRFIVFCIREERHDYTVAWSSSLS